MGLGLPSPGNREQINLIAITAYCHVFSPMCVIQGCSVSNIRTVQKKKVSNIRTHAIHSCGLAMDGNGPTRIDF
jgi:hypothetical protein